MKILELTAELENSLSIVCDAALKNAGFNVYPHVKNLESNIKVKEDDIKEKKK